MSRRDPKKEIDPEELMARKFRAKCRFRALGRIVMENAYWMIEGVDQYEGFDDVKRRVEQAVRGKAKKKQLLTIHDKALLNKPAHERTEHEKKYIYRIIGGLKCFKRYPNHVKKKLAAATYFKYYGPNRVIVRQHQEAHALYFIVSGKVVVSHLVWDELLERHDPQEIGVMQTGEMFGEVSLLHNIPRTATVTTAEHCEFLELFKEDFKNILQATVQKQWDEVRFAMSAFSYFDTLDEVALREGCIVARLRSYETNETLLGDGRGVQNYVYFILSGQCQMIDALQIIVTETLNRKYFQLYDPYVAPEPSEQDLEKKYFDAYKDKLMLDASNASNMIKQSTPQMKTSTTQSKGRLSSILHEGEMSRTRQSTQQVNTVDSPVQDSPVQSKGRLSGILQQSKGRLSGILHDPEMGKSRQSRPSVSILKDSKEGLLTGSIRKSKDLSSTATSAIRHSSVRISTDEGEGHGKTLLPPSEVARESVRFSVAPQMRKPSNIRTYFMQVCLFNPGSTFGFGENMRDRRIVAKTPVYCMLMPKIWLLQRNTANIWTRIQHFLDKKIPSKADLFKEFLSFRRWEEFRDQIVEDVVLTSKAVNMTTVHDVPYSVRMEEFYDI